MHRLRFNFKLDGYPILVAIGLRLGLSLWFSIIWLTVDQYFPDTSHALRQAYHLLERQSSLIGRMFVDVWLRWDAVHLMNIAKYGYAYGSYGELNYFPLYSYATRIIYSMIGGNIILAGLIVSTISTIILFVLLYSLCFDYWQNPELSKMSILVLAVYPTVFFLFAPFSDSLFLCLTIGFFLALNKRRWLIAGILASLAGATRAQGILLVLPIGYEFLKEFLRLQNNLDEENTNKLKMVNISSSLLHLLLAISIAPLGWITFNVWRNIQSGIDIFTSFSLYSKVKFVTPIQSIILAFKQAFSTGDLLVYSEILSLLIFGVVISWMLTKKHFRKQTALMLYSVSTYLLLLSKVSTQASVYQSANRYVLSLFPVFFGIATFVNSLPPIGRRFYLLTSSIALLIASTLYVLWFFVG